MKNIIKGLLIGLCIISSSAFSNDQQIIDAINLQQQINEAIQKDNEAYKKEIHEQIVNDLQSQFPNANIN